MDVTLILAAWKPVFSQQPTDEDAELPAPPAPRLPGHCHVPALMIMDWTSELLSQPLNNKEGEETKLKDSENIFNNITEVKISQPK